jgi:hypothetical protein
MVLPYLKGLVIIKCDFLYGFIDIVWLLYLDIFGYIVIFCIQVFGS